MNIFVLDRNPELCAQYHNNSHVVKMIVEYAQILSTAHRVLDGIQYCDRRDNRGGRRLKRWKLDGFFDRVVYKATHYNHPSAVWARQSSSNYKWLSKLFSALCREYTHRYGKRHKCADLVPILGTLPKNIPLGQMTPFAQAMPEEYFCKNPVIAYRNYYVGEKSNFNNYTNRQKPGWLLYEESKWAETR